MNKTISVLGLARKSGNLSLGTDCVKQAMLNKQSKLIVIASDVSKRSFQKFKKYAENDNVSIIIMKASMDEVEDMFGKKVGVISVNNEGFAKKIIELED